MFFREKLRLIMAVSSHRKKKPKEKRVRNYGDESLDQSPKSSNDATDLACEFGTFGTLPITVVKTALSGI
jgi:hypothetical protein